MSLHGIGRSANRLHRMKLCKCWITRCTFFAPQVLDNTLFFFLRCRHDYMRSVRMPKQAMSTSHDDDVIATFTPSPGPMSSLRSRTPAGHQIYRQSPKASSCTPYLSKRHDLSKLWPGQHLASVDLLRPRKRLRKMQRVPQQLSIMLQPSEHDCSCAEHCDYTD